MIIRSQRVVTPFGVRPQSVHIEGERIAAVKAWDDTGGGELVDAGDAAVMPGVVDTHVHINEPGRTDWEGFETATRAAAAGGVTSIVEMPLNSIPATTTVAALLEKLAAAGAQPRSRAAQNKLSVDVGFWGGVVPGNTAELEPLWKAGVFGFKCFMVPSGVAEFEHVTERDLREAMPVLARLGAPLLVHAELPGPIDEAADLEACQAWEGREYSCYLASRPREAEHQAIAMVIRLARETGARVHIVHVASADAAPMLALARQEGVRLTAETCPHYLHFAAEDIPDGGCQYKCAPPIRERENNERLWRALKDGVLDLVASDHSPCPPALKQLDAGDFSTAWGGIASLQLALAVTWTGAAARGGTLADVAGWMSAAPARLAGLDAKGAIEAGRDADLVIFRPDAEFVVDAAGLYHRHPVTPYAGARLRGVVERTYLRGSLVFDQGRFTGGHGKVLLRT